MPQSPIDIKGAVAPPAPLPPLAINYQPLDGFCIEHNQWVVQIDTPRGSSLRVGGQTYDLLNVHFHEPSEHYIEGDRFAMEAHFVHRLAGTTEMTNNLCVLGVVLSVGAANPLLDKICDHLPKNKGDKVELAQSLNLTDLLPQDTETYRFMGSRTTEPFDENVRWIIFTQPLTTSKAQVEKFYQVLQDNTRPLQPLKNRDIFICKGC